VPPHNPTVFEYFRRELKRPAQDAWVVAPSNGFNRIGSSDNRSYGENWGAQVILPKQLLAAAMAGKSGIDYEHLLRDNYESPTSIPTAPSTHEEMHQTAEILKLSLNDFATHAKSLASPDELSVFIARRLMQQLAPSLLWITLHDIDIAHSGAYSLYIDGIRRSDRLCGEIWQAIETNPEYKGCTTMFILPDFGRDSDMNPGGNGFQHHRTGDALSRTTWMMVLGPGVRQNVFVNRPVDSLDLVPTLGAMMGFSPSLAKGRPLTEVL
jgi:arylsulfatase A-like enzyme